MRDDLTRTGYVLITGGAGFVGSNLAHALLAQGEHVIVLDNLSRTGVEHNVKWLEHEHPTNFQFVLGDCSDFSCVAELARHSNHVFHFAAQVAVTHSLVDPLLDFEVNARGTLNVLEAIRRQPRPPALTFTSTNKVYGALADIELDPRGLRYQPSNPAFLAGIDESRSLDFHSPYGCSKGAADQYVLDYARSFGISASVFRMSCIYGPRQFGTEDQGWVAHFLISALRGTPITVYGDGLQVRDLLFVDDLVMALLLARQHAARLTGQAFNIGGGSSNSSSLLELLESIGRLIGQPPIVQFEASRPGDQRYYVSNSRKFSKATSWQPMVPLWQGLSRLLEWLEHWEVAKARRSSAARWLAPRQGAA